MPRACTTSSYHTAPSSRTAYAPPSNDYKKPLITQPAFFEPDSPVSNKSQTQKAFVAFPAPPRQPETTRGNVTGKARVIFDSDQIGILEALLHKSLYPTQDDVELAARATGLVGVVLYLSQAHLTFRTDREGELIFAF